MVYALGTSISFKRRQIHYYQNGVAYFDFDMDIFPRLRSLEVENQFDNSSNYT